MKCMGISSVLVHNLMFDRTRISVITRKQISLLVLSCHIPFVISFGKRKTEE